MLDKMAVVGAVGRYLKHHPEEPLRVAKNALFLRFGLPLDALRWAAGQLRGKHMPKDVQLEAVPPGIRVGASVDLMGTPVRASAVIFIERIRFNAEELRVEVRLADVALKVLDDAVESPVAALLKSGALDLSKPGNLAAYMPKRPPVLVEAEGDRVVIDLMKEPKLARDPRLARLIGLITPLLGVRAIETDWEHLDVALRPFPDGILEAVEALRAALQGAAPAPAAAMG
ncbi:MAG: hypothetical protein OZ921_20530 [Sorangiineae bacterium]|nr:hypothetical protein [Polyangiaceae bacterium]MEB2324912.1 hypothetical protein [Sorangiineae bacterium]